MARSRYKIFEDQYPHFFTSTIVNWIPIFGSRPIAQIILDSLQFLQDNDRLIVHAYVIMENHLHIIASSENLSKEIGNFRSFTARKIIDFLNERNAKNVLKQLAYYKLRHKKDRDYQLWQEGTHPQRVHDLAMMQQKIEYIHNNPVKRGYVDDPIHWRYSSARNYAGQPGLLNVDMGWF
jgi:REP element-mobilizing transposase RayT